VGLQIVTAAQRLREVLVELGIEIMPGCFDAISAKLVADAADFRFTHWADCRATRGSLFRPVKAGHASARHCRVMPLSLGRPAKV